ncbi:MAG: hypothetical protein MUE52_00940 [Tabrizicola sp.]|jgi:glutamate dehydrogenase/leucine dehydrogenase|nr:hypothetical protein [Tabrizicola sp.]
MPQNPPVLHDIQDPKSGLRAYLAVHSVEGGLAFGGLRVDPNVTADMVQGLAVRMAMKLSGHGSPVGGAKAGICADPNDPKLPGMLRAFAQHCRDELTSRTILGKDMGAKDWMLETIYAALGVPQLGLVRRRNPDATCPEKIGNLAGYIDRMTGQGVLWAAQEALDQSLAGKRILIQGAGAVGIGVATRLVEAGARVIGISDRLNAVHDQSGLPLAYLEAAKGNDGLLPTHLRPTGAQVMNRDALLQQDADVLILAAGSLLIDAKTASTFRCPVVVEGANFPLLPDARQWLHEHGVWVVPDVVASSSSAAMVAYQMASANTCEVHGLWNAIRTNIETNVRRSKEMSDRHGVDTVKAFSMMMADPVSAPVPVRPPRAGSPVVIADLTEV